MTKNGKQILFIVGMVILIMAIPQNDNKKEGTPVAGPAPLGAVSCWYFNSKRCGIVYSAEGITSFEFCGGIGVRTTLFKGEEMMIVSRCEYGNKIQLLSSSTEPPVYQCEIIGWNDYYLKDELEQELSFEYGNSCDSCSGNLCVKSSDCQIGQIRCIDETTFNSCKTISHQYFVPFQRFSDQVQNCPSGYTCSQEQDECIPSPRLICDNLKSTAINSINQWTSNPIQSNKEAALNALSGWAEVC